MAGSCEHHRNGAAGFLIVVSFLAGSVEMDTSSYGLCDELTTYPNTRACTLLQRLLLTHVCRAYSLNTILQADGLHGCELNIPAEIWILEVLDTTGIITRKE